MATAPPFRLTAEMSLYEANKASWLATHKNAYVVIKDKEILGFYPAFHDGYLAGLRKFGGDTDFLVKRVVENEPVFVVF